MNTKRRVEHTLEGRLGRARRSNRSHPKDDDNQIRNQILFTPTVLYSSTYADLDKSSIWVTFARSISTISTVPLADPNRSNVSIPLTPPPFSPPRYAIWVNSLWFLSLAISLTSALLATLLQQWARRYIKITQPRYSPHRRGRIRAFFYEGIDKFHLPWAVEALPTLLHLSLFLFFSGLLVFLLNIDHTVFSVVVGWVGFCTGIYVYITFVPLFRHDSPYYAPPSSSAWFLAKFFETGSKRYHERFVDGLVKTAEDFALNSSSEIDGRVLMWTLNSSDDDHDSPNMCTETILQSWSIEGSVSCHAPGKGPVLEISLM
ncbi:hypothetical protein H4582DRAFT_2082488 [Lactarius indigo]|nr:hypothetical protein H4582DRAFT_2082488 [Lactarius indigo]